MCLWTKNSIFTEEHSSMWADHQVCISPGGFFKAFWTPTVMPIGQMISEPLCLMINPRMSILHLSVLFIYSNLGH